MAADESKPLHARYLDAVDGLSTTTSKSSTSASSVRANIGPLGVRHVGRVLGRPGIAVGARPGTGEESPVVEVVRRDAELPRVRQGDVRQRGVPVALRADVLPGTARRRSGEGAHRRPGRGPGRVVEPPVVHRWHRGSDAASAQPPRHRPLVPLPEHVRLSDLRPVQRAAADDRPAPRVTDRPPPDRDPRLRRRAQRSPTGGRGRARRQGIDGELGESTRRHR